MEGNSSKTDSLLQTASKEESMTTTECTPRSREQGDRNPIMRTPHSGLSSSLKERLKRCGRYHPATPPSSHQTTPTSSLYRTQMPAAHSVSMSSASLQGTPTTTIQHLKSPNRAYSHSPVGIKKTLPQPRNILKEKSLLSNHCEKGTNFENDSEQPTGFLTTVIDHDEAKGKHAELDNGHTKICPSAENSDSNPQSEGLPVVNALPVVRDFTRKETASVESEEKSTSEKEGSMPESSVVTSSVGLIEAKKRLTAQLVQQKETLRKLHMVKTYRAKHDLVELQTLIDKWRSACQQAVLDLHQLTSDPRPSLTQLVHQLGIDQKLVHYNEDCESFEDD